MEYTQDVDVSQPARTMEELRAEMFRILDEIPNARADRAAALGAKFKALWEQLGTDQPTVH